MITQTKKSKYLCFTSSVNGDRIEASIDVTPEMSKLQIYYAFKRKLDKEGIDITKRTPFPHTPSLDYYIDDRPSYIEYVAINGQKIGWQSGKEYPISQYYTKKQLEHIRILSDKPENIKRRALYAAKRYDKLKELKSFTKIEEALVNQKKSYFVKYGPLTDLKGRVKWFKEYNDIKYKGTNIKEWNGVVLLRNFVRCDFKLDYTDLALVHQLNREILCLTKDSCTVKLIGFYNHIGIPDGTYVASRDKKHNINLTKV